jgi:uncharacterized protein YndB with AHSA1/START domain
MSKWMTGIVMLACIVMTDALWANEKAISEKITVKANVDDVWKAWTTNDGIRSFFAPDAKVEPRPGGAFQIYMNPLAEPGFKGADDMVVLAVQEKRLLSFTWNAPPSLPEARKQRTVVIVRFVARGDALTDVTLYHAGWGEGGEWDKTYDYFVKAWPSVLKNLKKRFDDGPINWTPWLEQLKKSQEKSQAAQPAAKK